MPTPSKNKLKYSSPRMPFRWAMREGTAFSRISLLYRQRSTTGMMAGLAAPLVFDLGCDRIQVFEAGADGNALVCFSANGSEVFRIEVRCENQIVRIEVASAKPLLVRSLPLCRRYFDGWFASPPVCEEVSMLLAPPPQTRGKDAASS